MRRRPIGARTGLWNFVILCATSAMSCSIWDSPSNRCTRNHIPSGRTHRHNQAVRPISRHTYWSVSPGWPAFGPHWIASVPWGVGDLSCARKSSCTRLSWKITLTTPRLEGRGFLAHLPMRGGISPLPLPTGEELHGEFTSLISLER